jgi:dihydroorotase
MDLTIEGKAFVNGEFQQCCIGVKDGKIHALKKILKGDTHYRFSNRLILPAGVDIHVHFRDPGLTHKEDFSTGSLAAAFAGISCVFDMPNTIPQTISTPDLVEKISVAERKTFVDFGVYCGVTKDNISNIEGLSENCNGFKVYLNDTTNWPNVDNTQTYKLLSRVLSTSKLVLFHAEDHHCLRKHKKKELDLASYLKTRPAECEETAIQNILAISKENQSKVHICHLSSCEGLEQLKNKKGSISVGVTPHHLLFSIEKNLVPPTWYKVNPPIRTNLDREALFNGIKNDWIDVIESDHAPHTLDEKNVDFENAPPGIPGIETGFPLFLFMAKKGVFSFSRLIHLFCENPAELLGVSKGKIAIGRDADLVVIDLQDTRKIKTKDLHSKCGWTPFEGRPAIFPSHVFVRGEKIIEDNDLQVRQGFGRFVGG